MSLGDTRLRAILTAIPVGATDGWNRYDTDNEHVLSFWRDGQTWDIRVSKDRRGEGPLHIYAALTATEDPSR